MEQDYEIFMEDYKRTEEQLNEKHRLVKEVTKYFMVSLFYFFIFRLHVEVVAG